MVYAEEFYNEIFNNISEGVYFVDVNRKITFWNRGAEIITGYKSSEVVGSSCSDNILVHVDEEGRHLCIEGCPLFDTIKDGQKRNINAFLHHKDGHRVPVNVTAHQIITPEGKILGAVETFRNISGTVKDEETRDILKEDDLLDILTGLVNRLQIEKKLISSLEDYKKHNISFGIIMADIDNLKDINTTYGDTFGDKVLMMVAKTLVGNIQSFDIIGRWDGGKFAGIITHTNEKKLMILSNKLRMLVEESFINHNNTKVSVTISVGATLTKPYDTYESLIDRVVTLLFQAKNSGKNRVIIDTDNTESDNKKKYYSKKRLFRKNTPFKRYNWEYDFIIYSILLMLLFLSFIYVLKVVWKP